MPSRAPIFPSICLLRRHSWERFVRARAGLDEETEVAVLWVAADAPQATRDELFLVFLILLRTTPCSLLTISGDLDEKSAGI
jgi:hypothetical protein